MVSVQLLEVVLIQLTVRSSDCMLVRFDDYSGQRAAIFRERIKKHLIKESLAVLISRGNIVFEDHLAFIFFNAFRCELNFRFLKTRRKYYYYYYYYLFFKAIPTAYGASLARQSHWS